MGLSVQLTKQQAYRKTGTGSYNWCAPEIVNGVMYSKEIDVWAFGAFAHELATGEPPFKDLLNDEESLFQAITEARIAAVPSRSDKFNNLMLWCF